MHFPRTVRKGLSLFSFLVCVLALTHCGRASGGLEEGLYLRTLYAFRNLDISTVYLGPGNRIIMNPDGGVDPVDVSKLDPKNVGTYQYDGNKTLNVQWGGGRGAQALGVEFDKGHLSALDGGLVSKAESYGKNRMLDATYSGAISAGGGAVAASRDLTLTKDGKFSMGTVGSISTGATSGISSGSAGGTYTLNGNTLTLKFADGKVEKRTVLPFNTAAEPAKATLSDDHMIFEHMSLKRVK